MPAILAFAMEVLSTLPPLIEAGIDVMDLINSTNASLKRMQAENNRNPSDSEWADMRATIEELRSQRPDVDEPPYAA